MGIDRLIDQIKRASDPVVAFLNNSSNKKLLINLNTQNPVKQELKNFPIVVFLENKKRD